MTKKIVLASNNSHKIKEFKNILMDVDVELIPQRQLDIKEIDETGLSFVENAILKARNASKLSGLPAISDDSGIEVDILSGRPGIYSARFAGKECNDKLNNNFLLEELNNIPIEKRKARYQCVIVYMLRYDHPSPKIFSSSWDGVISHKESGNNGFGYDSLFFLPELNCTAAELTEGQKNSISHRGKALGLFKKDLMFLL